MNPIALREMVLEHGGEELVKIADSDPQAFHEFVEAYFAEQGIVKVNVGTAEATIQETDKIVTVIGVINREQHNGDFQRLMDDLEGRGKPVLVEALWNKRLRKHLIEKRGYRPCKKNGAERVIKDRREEAA